MSWSALENVHSVVSAHAGVAMAINSRAGSMRIVDPLDVADVRRATVWLGVDDKGWRSCGAEQPDVHDESRAPDVRIA
ncbi:hypothetical protein PAGU2638_24360 [Lysobacter sp. PAGU 2638]